MPTHEWMQNNGARRTPARPKAAGRSVVEIGLAITGVLAWIWCAYEIYRAIAR